jgi:hypothetical protein
MVMTLLTTAVVFACSVTSIVTADSHSSLHRSHHRHRRTSAVRGASHLVNNPHRELAVGKLESNSDDDHKKGSSSKGGSERPSKSVGPVGGGGLPLATGNDSQIITDYAEDGDRTPKGGRGKGNSGDEDEILHRPRDVDTKKQKGKAKGIIEDDGTAKGDGTENFFQGESMLGAILVWLLEISVSGLL